MHRILKIALGALTLVGCTRHERATYRPVPPFSQVEATLPVSLDEADRCWKIFDLSDPALVAHIRLGTGDAPWKDGELDGELMVLLRAEGATARGRVLGAHDAYLLPNGPYLGRASEYIGSDGLGMPYTAEYVVRVSAADQNQIKVVVEPLLYRIYGGRHAMVAHGLNSDVHIQDDVPSSHWDDQRVLLCFAACLGVEKRLLSRMTPPHINPKVDWLKPCRPEERL